MIRTIEIVLNDGNMGDGWVDQYTAACAYAEFLRTYLPANGYPEAIVDVEVKRKTSGWCPAPSAHDENGDEVSSGSESVAATCDRAWQAFCESHEARLLSGEA